MVKPYGFKNENNPVKDTYELTIPETVVPIENPTGRQHRLARSIFKKRAARSLYAESHWSILYGTLVHSVWHFWDGPCSAAGDFLALLHSQT